MPKKPMTWTKWKPAVRDFTTRLVLMKAEAGRLGLLRTMHNLDLATNITGYEQADILTGKQVRP